MPLSTNFENAETKAIRAALRALNEREGWPAYEIADWLSDLRGEWVDEAERDLEEAA